MEEAIASSVAALIPDGATIQFGVGRTPDAVLRKLVDKRDLGVHSGLISDALVDLIETGVVTNRRKPIDPSVTVTGALLGTDRLYRWADRNPDLAMRALSYTHDPRILAAFDHFYAINSALEVDLTGQINAETVGGRHLGTIGGQGAFARAALTSPGGRSIIALPSVARPRGDDEDRGQPPRPGRDHFPGRRRSHRDRARRRRSSRGHHQRAADAADRDCRPQTPR